MTFIFFSKKEIGVESNFNFYLYKSIVFLFWTLHCQRKFKKHKVDILNGPTSQSRFGMALSRLGDINYDGYDGKNDGEYL